MIKRAAMVKFPYAYGDRGSYLDVNVFGGAEFHSFYFEAQYPMYTLNDIYLSMSPGRVNQ